ncbi:MAG TPA: cytochrome C oxidase subunit IV family protein [Herpetosiphonaceae bacterium]
MAKHSSSQTEVAAGHDHAPSHARLYVNIFFVLFAVTMIEVFASYLSDYGVPVWSEIAVLILLSIIKGALVVMFYMHLRFDSRWFTSLFIGGVAIAVLMGITFILLWAYKASVGGLVV